MSGLPYPLLPKPSGNPSSLAAIPTPPRVSPVEVPQSFPELRNKTEAELQDMLYNESKLSSIIDGNSQLQNLRRERGDLVTNALKLARENLAMRESLEHAKEGLLELVDRLNVSRGTLESSMNQLEAAKREYSQDWLVTSLRVAASEAEDMANSIMQNQFINSSSSVVDVDEVLKSFIESKKLHYLRKTKEEKLLSGQTVQ